MVATPSLGEQAARCLVSGFLWLVAPTWPPDWSSEVPASQPTPSLQASGPSGSLATSCNCSCEELNLSGTIFSLAPAAVPDAPQHDCLRSVSSSTSKYAAVQSSCLPQEQLSLEAVLRGEGASCEGVSHGILLAHECDETLALSLVSSGTSRMWHFM